MRVPYSRVLGQGRALARAVLTGFIAPLLMASLSYAQPEFATFRGTVTDEQGSPLEGATLLVRLVTRDQGEEIATNKKGAFLHRGFRPGEYEITVQKDSYQGYQETLRLEARRTVNREYQLKSLITPAHAAFVRGAEAFNAGNFEEAALAFEESVELAPDVVDGHSNLAATYARLGRDDDVIRELEKVIELSPDSFEGQLLLGASYAQMNRYEDAIETYEAAMAREHDPSAAGVHDAWVNLGALYFMQERTRDAVGAFEKAVASDPRSAKALLSLGKAHFNLGETSEALARFQQVVDIAPESPEASEAKEFIAALENPKGP